MQYKEIDRIPQGFKKVGYALFNKKTMDALTTGDNHALVVRAKLKDFEYHKGFTPAEIAFEHILIFILEFGEYYAFDKESFVIFAKYMKEEFPEYFEYFEEWNLQENLEKLDNQKDALIVIGLKTKFDPQLN